LGDLSIDRDQREKSKTGRFEQLPESKTKISHHKNNNNVGMRHRAQLDSN